MGHTFGPNRVLQRIPAQPQIALPRPQGALQSGQFSPQPQAQQQFGLSGAEQAQQAGLTGSLSAIQQGTGGALSQLQQAGQILGGDFSAQAAQVDPLTGRQQFQQAAAGVGQFAPAGVQAQQLQSALSGVGGQQAFQQALLDSPQQQFIRQRQQEALAGQASAAGGLGSGQFQTELQQLGAAQAAQQVQQQIQNLSALSGQGLQAAGQQGQFLSQAGQQEASLASQQAGLQQQAAQSNVARQLQAAQGQAGVLGQAAGLQQQAGLSAADLFRGTGQQVAAGRLQAGRDIAGQIGSSTSALANLSQQQGAGLSGLIGQGSQNLAGLLSGAGQNVSGQQQQLAQLLANLSVGAGTNQASLQQQGGQFLGQQAAASTQGNQETLGAIAGLAAAFFSDTRLKDNIVKTHDENGINFYEWTWNGNMPIKALVGKNDSGVLAQEIEQVHPELVATHESGYKIVNYDGLRSKLWQQDSREV